MTLNFDRDTICQHLAQYLMAGLNALDSRLVVATVSDHDRFVLATALEFPLLQVYRGGSVGRHLNECEIRVEYYLQNPQAYFNQPNILRVIEVEVANLLEIYQQTGENPCLQIDLGTLRSSGPQYLRFGPNGENVFPYIRIQFKCTDLER